MKNEDEGMHATTVKYLSLKRNLVVRFLVAIHSSDKWNMYGIVSVFLLEL